MLWFWKGQVTGLQLGGLFFFFWLLGPVGNAGGLLAAWGWAGGISQMGSTGRGSRSGLWALDLDPEWHLDSRSLIFWSRGGVTHRLVKNPQTTKLLELGVPGFGFAPKCSLLFFLITLLNISL